MKSTKNFATASDMELHSSAEFIISCEHAGNLVPDEYQYLFEGAGDMLKSHRGWDPGSLELAQTLAKITGFHLYSYPFTRLLIEPNRSITHHNLFSEITKKLDRDVKIEIIEKYYLAHRNRIINAVKENASQKRPTIHIGVHTFTPILDNVERDFEIGLLYDPNRILEKKYCKIWKSLLKARFPQFRIRMNQPYQGSSDGFTTFLRKTYDEKYYLGIELEMNQRFYFDPKYEWNQICKGVAHSLLRLKEFMDKTT